MAAGVLFDIDGVLAVSWRPLPGAAEAVARTRASGRPVALVTNTSSRTRRSIVERLGEGGIEVPASAVFTATRAAALYLGRHHAGATCLWLNSGDVTEDLEGVEVVGPDDPGAASADVVLLGGAGPEIGWPALNVAFRLVDAGAPLVALHRNTRWQTDEGPNLDMGVFLAGLEEATGAQATIVGKPAEAFFAGVLEALGAERDGTVMVGDDVDADVLGAQAAGLHGVLVRTGKYTDATLERADGDPDDVIDSVADLPDLLGL
jgi:HAD superfamily hydrolase (TIGR01458 family)